MARTVRTLKRKGVHDFVKRNCPVWAFHKMCPYIHKMYFISLDIINIHTVFVIIIIYLHSLIDPIIRKNGIERW